MRVWLRKGWDNNNEESEHRRANETHWTPCLVSTAASSACMKKSFERRLDFY
jgi:hypothetical protein